MRSKRVAFSLLVVVAVGCTHPLLAGTYSQVLERIRENDPTFAGNFQPVAMEHPPGQVRAGGAVVVRICVRPGSEALVPSVNWPIETWDALVPRYGNCRGCLTIEERIAGTPQPGTLVDLRGTILHELGHCARMNGTVDSAASGTLGLPLLWSSIAMSAYTRKERQEQTAAGGGGFCSNQDTRVGANFATSVINAALEGRLTFGEALDLAGLRGRDFRDCARHLGIDLT